MTAPLPDGIDGHFGPQLRRFVLAQYHQGQMTVPRLVTLLRSFGILICKRQVLRLLIERQDDFLTEARDTLWAGLLSAAWITVDDTGARHKATNGFCTQIGNAHFAWFGTTGSKSRLNFLELLTGFVTLDRLLMRLNANKPELLMVLDRPEIPLHTNGSENDIRCHVTRRKVSGGTRSDVGRDCRDAFLGLAKTCAKLEIAFWDYLGARLAVPGSHVIPPLPQIILARARSP
jgi:hypothetical protein